MKGSYTEYDYCVHTEENWTKLLGNIVFNNIESVEIIDFLLIISLRKLTLCIFS